MRKIKDIAEMTKDDIMSAELIAEVFDIVDEIERTYKINALRDRATELKCTKNFNSVISACKKAITEQKKKIAAQQREEEAQKGLVTEFSGIGVQLQCAAWVANDGGIVMRSLNPAYPDRLACYHPIIPRERMRNIQTGEEQIKISFKRRGDAAWSDIVVPKSVIASTQKIVDLASYGIAVNSNNAKWLIAYLADVENLNGDKIPLLHSTSKLGWIDHGGKRAFMPYRPEGIEFDNDNKFRQICKSLTKHGDFGIWLKHMKRLRASGKLEIRLMMAASFASVLIKPCGTLPFIMDLWGDTEGGKTVTLMVAASIWANPADNAYIGDYKSTDTALEARADMLNSLPLILDDTSKTSKKMRESMEGIVYDLCSGKGKSRSNKSLGINRENTWNCSILTCGEKPLQDYVEQGGAINRIIEIPCSDYLYDDPHCTAELVKSNYGFAGEMFVHAVAVTDPSDLERQLRDIYQSIATDDKMQKQAYAMSLVLLADRIAENVIFQDGITIAVEDAAEVMSDRAAVSDNQRAYEYIRDKYLMNPARFDPETDKAVEQWGIYMGDGYVGFFPASFVALVQEGGFGVKPLLTWLNKKGLLDHDNDRKRFTKKTRKVNNKPFNVYKIKIDMDAENDDKHLEEEDFSQIDLPLDFDEPL